MTMGRTPAGLILLAVLVTAGLVAAGLVCMLGPGATDKPEAKEARLQVGDTSPGPGPMQREAAHPPKGAPPAAPSTPAEGPGRVGDPSSQPDNRSAQNPWDPGVPTRWLTPELSGDPGTVGFHLGLLRHPERPAAGDDAAEPAQEELVFYALLSAGREVKCRIQVSFDADDGRGLQSMAWGRGDFTQVDSSATRCTRAGLFFEELETIERGETYEALVTTWDAGGDTVRTFTLRFVVP